MASLRRLVDRLLSIGSYPDESDTQRARRRIMVAAIWLAMLFTILGNLSVDAGYFWVGLGDTAIIAVTVGALIGLHRKPRRFAVIINLLLATAFAVGLIQTARFGGLLESGLVVVFGLIIVLAGHVASGPGRQRGGLRRSLRRSSTRS